MLIREEGNSIINHVGKGRAALFSTVQAFLGHSFRHSAPRKRQSGVSEFASLSASLTSVRLIVPGSMSVVSLVRLTISGLMCLTISRHPSLYSNNLDSCRSWSSRRSLGNTLSSRSIVSGYRSSTLDSLVRTKLSYQSLRKRVEKDSAKLPREFCRRQQNMIQFYKNEI